MCLCSWYGLTSLEDGEGKPEHETAGLEEPRPCLVQQPCSVGEETETKQLINVKARTLSRWPSALSYVTTSLLAVLGMLILYLMLILILWDLPYNASTWDPGL